MCRFTPCAKAPKEPLISFRPLLSYFSSFPALPTHTLSSSKGVCVQISTMHPIGNTIHYIQYLTLHIQYRGRGWVWIHIAQADCRLNSTLEGQIGLHRSIFLFSSSFFRWAQLARTENFLYLDLSFSPLGMRKVVGEEQRQGKKEGGGGGCTVCLQSS